MTRYQRRRVAPRPRRLLRLRGPRTPPFHLLGLAAALGCAAACSDPSPSGVVSAAVRDSAGIEIVEHAAGALEATPIWKLSAEPMLRIGAVEGDPDEQRVRIGDALRLLNVKRGRPHELEVRDRGGDLLRLVRWRGPDLAVHPPDVEAFTFPPTAGSWEG